MNLNRSTRLVVVALLLFSRVAFGKDSPAPVDPTLLKAKTAYVDNQTDSIQLENLVRKELRGWNRFSITLDKNSADIVLEISSSDTSFPGKEIRLVVLDPQTAGKLWLDGIFVPKPESCAAYVPKDCSNLNYRDRGQCSADNLFAEVSANTCKVKMKHPPEPLAAVQLVKHLRKQIEQAAR